jgi:short-subunit dehydrogenase
VNLPRRLLDAWISRYAAPSLAALDAVSGRKPGVVVTGGSHGIGLAIARRFAKAGCDVALLARGARALQEAAAAIEEDFAVAAIAIAVDVTAANAPQTIDLKLTERGYYTDILVNSAAVGLSGPFFEQGSPEIARLLDLNVGALTRLTRHVLPGMLGRARGGIVNVASLGGMVPGPYQAAYYASKAYVISLTEALAAENAGSGVRFSAVAPGPINTDLLPPDEQVRGFIVSRTALGRIGEPVDVARVVAFLASDWTSAMRAGSSSSAGPTPCITLLDDVSAVSALR